MTRDVAGTTGAAVKTGATALLAALALEMPFGGGFWIPQGLALGARGDLLLALAEGGVWLSPFSLPNWVRQALIGWGATL